MRYALYLFPDPESALWRKASALIGYDAATGDEPAQPSLPKVSPQALQAATEDPRRYGFHLTLKAPFRLAEGQTEETLRAALALFGAQRRGFALGPLELEARIGSGGDGFVCLTPAAPCPAIFLLEQDVVRAFEPFRAPLNAHEIARRRPQTLSPRQRALLDAYGYPFVLDEFRPHFSLTGRVESPAQWLESLRGCFEHEDTLANCSIDRIGLFRQQTSTERFVLIDSAPLKSP